MKEKCYGVFFFKQKTAYEVVSRDWSSDVCSSDLSSLKGHIGSTVAPKGHESQDIKMSRGIYESNA